MSTDLERLHAEHAVMRSALEKIAGQDSAPWGWMAHDALRVVDAIDADTAGWACAVCGGEDGPMVPISHSVLFMHSDCAESAGQRGESAA